MAKPLPPGPLRMAIAQANTHDEIQAALREFRENLTAAMAVARAYMLGGLFFCVLGVIGMLTFVLSNWYVIPGAAVAQWGSIPLNLLGGYFLGRHNGILRRAVAGVPLHLP